MHPLRPTRLRPEHGRCKGSGAGWGAGCSAIVTAAPERARKDGGDNLFVQRPGATFEPYSPLPSGDPATGPSAGEGKDYCCLRFGNVYCQRDFNFRSAQLSTSLQCRKKGRLFPCGKICPSPGRWSLRSLSEAIFPSSAGELFLPMEVQ